MKAYNRISIKQILDNILAHPMLQDITLERAINYAIEFIKIVGMPDAFEHKVETVKISNYQIDPSILEGCYQILSIRDDKGVVLSSSSSLFDSPSNPGAAPSYVVRGNIIQTSIKEGEVEVAYLSIPIEEESGLPTIPDIASYTRALEAYIKKQWFTILFDLGKLHNSILTNAQQEYAWAVGQAQSELAHMSLDEIEAFTNMWNSLLPRRNPYKTGFRNLGSGEYKKI